MAAQDIIVVDNLSKSFYPTKEKRTFFQHYFRGYIQREEAPDLVWALRNVSFTVGKGENFGVIGFNAAGKSTLLSIMAGILDPTEGICEVRGSVNTLLGLGSALLSDLSVNDNIRLCAALLGFTGNDLRKKVDAILDFGELGPFRWRRLGELSGGFAMRVPFSVAMHVDSDIVLVDEALAVGDINFQSKCKQAFENLRKQGKTIVIVSANVGGIKEFCTQALYLSDGKVVEVGPIEEITARFSADARDREKHQE